MTLHDPYSDERAAARDAYSDERAAARPARDQDPGYERERPSLAELRDDEREAAAHETARIQRNTVRIDGWDYWRGGR